MTDITYKNHGLFTSFYPESKEGEEAWKQMAEQTEGTGKILSIFAANVVQQLRAAGYKVSKAKAENNKTLIEVLKELDELVKE